MTFDNQNDNVADKICLTFIAWIVYFSLKPTLIVWYSVECYSSPHAYMHYNESPW